MERQLEYEKGPQTDDEPTAASATDGRDDAPANGLRSVRGLPWRAGLLFGLGSFLLTYGVTLQAVAATASLYGTGEGGPGAWVSAGLVTLSNHGVSIAGDVTTEGGAPLPLEISTALSSSTYVSHFVPLLALAAAGYGLVRYTERTTVRGAVGAAVTIVPSYLAGMVALAVLTRYTYDPAETAGMTGGGDEVVTFAAPLGETVLLAGLVVPTTLAVVGGLLAIWPRPLDRLLGERERERDPDPDATPGE
ncbi:hypothetical protein [Natrononativus amylolyticus]|uniref:hypothetical protein n=1 Tax=Natrononativus amylolyticus TaxID=2963434 RepID=UPI0020CBAEC0|nr:hypothetical protein [Natrononativus amylolyticus]